MATYEQVKAVFEDKEKAVAILSCATPEEAKAKLAEYGVEMSLEDVIELGKGIKESAENHAELGDDSLESVTGGSLSSDCREWGRTIGRACGTVFGILVGFASGLW